MKRYCQGCKVETTFLAKYITCNFMPHGLKSELDNHPKQKDGSILCTDSEDDTRDIKPCHPREIEFDESRGIPLEKYADVYYFCSICSEPEQNQDFWKSEKQIKLEQQIVEEKKIQIRKGFSDSVRYQVLKNQNHRCNDCGKQIGELPKGKLVLYELDHIDSERSNNDISNCQALCLECHAKKTHKSRYMK